MPEARCDVIFRGRVQGVGFRGTAMNILTHYSITGYIANTRGGTVHMVAEGARASVSSLIQAILRTMAAFVSDHTETWSAGTGEFPDFQVRGNEP
jgi:acylphosphatase